MDDPEIHAKRATAAYADTVNRLRATSDLSDDEIDKRALEANEDAVWGHGFKRDRAGNPIQNGVGSPGHESANHYQAIKRYCTPADYQAALSEIWKRDPDRARKLNLEQPART